MKPPTLREIARAAGVSLATVSRALNGNRAMSEETRRHVLNVARDLNWKPNPLTSALMAHRRAATPTAYKATLGFLVDHPVDEMPGHIADAYNAASAQAAGYGYRMAAFSFREEGMTPQELDRVLYHRNIPGFIVSGFRVPGVRMPEFNWGRYAAVAIGSTLVEPRLNRVAVNFYRGFKLAIDSVFARGYRNLGIVGSVAYDERVGHGLMFPVAYAQQRLRPGFSMQTLMLDSHAPREIPKIQRWMRDTRPDAVLGVTLAREAIRAMGLRIPQDVAFASVDRNAAFPASAGLDQRHDLIGRLSADVLVAQVTNNQRGIPDHFVEHLVEGRWAEGTDVPVKTATRA